MAANRSDACGVQVTQLGFTGAVPEGTWMNCTELVDSPFTLSAVCSRLEVSMSVVIASAMSFTTDSIVVGLPRMSECSTPWSSDAIRNWSRWIRCRSEPSPTFSRVRQKASACCPPT